MRAAHLARRRALAAPSREEAARLVLAELTSLVRRAAPDCVAGYVPVGAEPGGPGLPDALAAGGRLLLPVLLPDLDLDWAEYAGHASLTPSPRGLREPSGRRLGPTAIATASLVVVPAVAVDRHGVRLGRGGGSYDRALARVTPGVPTVALLHDGELVDELPTEPHDRRVSAVITPGDGLVMLPA
ncbi:5-formyltetrahydrofolate cyclo-ligase [Actinomycetes bacterium KLBMP 9797]